MARMLGRSRSFRILKGGHKETHQREAGDSAPQPTLSAVEIERLKAATPVTRADNRVETPEPAMLQRPRTSGGPGDRSTQFHKKVLPTQRPGDSTTNLSISPPKSTAILYSAEVLSEEEGIIGIALGSPTMAPQHWKVPDSTDFLTQNQGTTTHISSNNRSPGSSRQVNEAHEEAPKPKLSRWKSIFRKTAPPPRKDKDSFYQLAKAAHSARVDNQHHDDSIDSRTPAQEEDADATPSPTYTFKSDIRPSRKAHKERAQPATDTRPRALTAGSASSGRSKPPLARFALSPRANASSTAVPSMTVSGSSQNTSPRYAEGKPLLDVAIPEVHMERYSVMFSGLLPSQTTNTSSALLQRRQGNSDKVKPLHDLSMGNNDTQSRDGMPRRATSPNLQSKSPSAQLSLFPSTNTSRTPSPGPITVNRPRPLKRSKTAPASSPSQPAFPPQSANKVTQETDYPDTPSLSRTSSPASERSFDSGPEDITIAATPIAPPPTWRPHLEDEEPVWEIIQRQTPTNPVTKTSALRSHPTNAALAFPSPQEPTPSSGTYPRLSRTRSHTLLTSAPRPTERVGTSLGVQATVGVARSVSVSRATKPKGLLSPCSVGVRSPVEGGLSPGRYVDGKSLTPTLVELKNRRSQRVQLEDA